MYRIIFAIALLFCISAVKGEASLKAMEIIREDGYPLPDKVTQAIKSTSLTYGENIAGKKIYETNVIRTKYLTIAKNAKLVFRLDPKGAHLPFIIIAADRVFIERPQSESETAEITYELTQNTNGISPAPSPDGLAGADGTGGNGTNGEDGHRGSDGVNFPLPPVYILFNEISIQGGTPSSSSLIKVVFNGVKGGDGGNGGDGGRAGNGGRGTDGRCEKICIPGGCVGFSCKAGPGRGGDTGFPGLGGMGGNGASGGNGADVRYFGPKETVNTVAFFTTYNFGAAPGVGGQGGRCGRTGQEGGGGYKACCDKGGGSGIKRSCQGKSPAPPGDDSKKFGDNGRFSITETSLHDLFN